MEILYTQKDYQEKSELANSQGLKLYRYQHDVEYTEVVGDWNYETQTITYTDIDGKEVTEEIQVKTTPIMTTGTIVTIDENGNEVETIGQVQQTHEETKTKQVEELVIADFGYYICTSDNITDGTLNENYEEEKLASLKTKKELDNDKALAEARCSHTFSVVVQGALCMFDTKPQTQEDLNSAAISTSFGTPWMWTTNNRVTIALTQQDVILIAAKYNQVVNPDIDKWTQYAESIHNAKTIEELNEITLDYSTSS